ncbi:hypothetical protein DK847_10555 [Aestuariivirga litoralis]|uniref:PKD domain-containing protein n=1 Tax=Aestuariivirga litoralis TaxID=2650924 RepID=A0A2W2B9C0_9HYPH|nr:PKD domain-containing protein [Aestuariivirga litoralis]PZF76894.1 hypothetical protein DK847_10555 [Aestuariivirga litoralis]
MSIIIRLAARVAMILGLLIMPAGAGLQAAAAKVFPTITVTTPGVSGNAAIAALGSNLPAVAAYYGWTADELRRKFQRDSGLRVGGTGRLFQSSPAGRLQPAAAAAARMAAGAQAFSMPWAGGTAPYPLDQTFALHSKADAPKTIYLNFAGKTLTAANNQQVQDLRLTSIVVPPFSIDAAPAFSDAERRIIQEVWQRVAEDYAPFDVDVTTEPPPPERITRTQADDPTTTVDENDPAFGIDVLFTPVSSVWNCGACGQTGDPIADKTYVLSYFDVGDRYKPSVVFHTGSSTGTQVLFAQDLADRASRAVGSSLGLAYRGTSTADLYEGHGNNAVNAWAPIMGGLSGRPLRQFSMGEYSDAIPTSSDPGDFEGLLGGDLGNALSLRADEAGNTTAAAEWLPVQRNAGPSTGSFDGVITSAEDSDVFFVKAGLGTFTATATPAAVGANADLVLTLKNSTGGIVPTNNAQIPNPNNPAGRLDAAITVANLAAGKYFLEVKGGGEGLPNVTAANAATGYSNYGSVGAYTLTASFVAPASTTPPSAQFTPLLPSGKGPLTVNFNASASAAATGSQIVRYTWDFGDTTTLESKTATVTHTYPEAPSSPQTYPVTLTVTDDTGLTRTATTTVTVEATNPGGPTANFTMSSSPATGRAPLQVTFDGSPSLPGGSPITSWAWQIGEPAIATLSGRNPPPYTFTKSGTFPVKLTVTNATLSAHTIQNVVVVNTAPTPSFDATPVAAGPVIAPAVFSLNASASSDADGSITTYEWSVDEPPGVANIAIPNKTTGDAFNQTFEKPGTYTIRLRVTDNLNLSEETIRQITVLAKPKPSFTPSASSGPAPLAVSFNPSGSTDDGQITSYRWEFGDGTSQNETTAAIVPKTFTVPGTYTVKLTVTPNTPPTASFTPSPSSGPAPLAVSFNPSGSTDDGQITSYHWEFGVDDAQNETTAAIVSRTFTEPGTYTVKLTVTDNAGLSQSTTRDVTVTPNTPPTASFTPSPSSGPAPLAVSFNPSGSTDDGQITSYHWEFGDDTTRNETTAAIVSRTFTAPGTYTVRLTVTDNAGLSHSTNRDVTVTPAVAPTASFTADRTEGVAPLSVTFDPAPSHDDVQIVSYRWTFDDGSVRTETTPVKVTKTFTTAGAHEVVLLVTDGASLSHEARLTVNVTARPVASFTASKLSGVAPLDVTFDASATTDDGQITNYQWDFGNGSTDSGPALQSAATRYTEPGTYTVRLTVTDNDGLTSESTATILVEPTVPSDAPKVASLTVKQALNRWKRPIARAEVTVVDEAGKPLRKAIVAVQWSGPFARGGWGSTRSNGIASFVTPPMVASGCYRITVTALKVGETTYAPSPEAAGELCR